jgi:hypothetical protein
VCSDKRDREEFSALEAEEEDLMKTDEGNMENFRIMGEDVDAFNKRFPEPILEDAVREVSWAQPVSWAKTIPTTHRGCDNQDIS